MFVLKSIDITRIKNAWVVSAHFRSPPDKSYAGCRQWAEPTVTEVADRVRWIMTAQWDNLDFPTMGEDVAGATTPSA